MCITLCSIPMLDTRRSKNVALPVLASRTTKQIVDTKSCTKLTVLQINKKSVLIKIARWDVVVSKTA